MRALVRSWWEAGADSPSGSTSLTSVLNRFSYPRPPACRSGRAGAGPMTRLKKNRRPTTQLPGTAGDMQRSCAPPAAGMKTAWLLRALVPPHIRWPPPAGPWGPARLKGLPTDRGACAPGTPRIHGPHDLPGTPRIHGPQDLPPPSPTPAGTLPRGCHGLSPSLAACESPWTTDGAAAGGRSCTG
jgi:hypothetical protein